MICPACEYISESPAKCGACGRDACDFCLLPDGLLAVCGACLKTGPCAGCSHDEYRALYGPGPWDGEPDRVEFAHETESIRCGPDFRRHNINIPCVIHRRPDGAWAGYVQLPAMSHAPALASFHVHGGISFYAVSDCYPWLPQLPKGAGWIGFDCAHPGFHHDQIPMAQIPKRGPQMIYRDVAFVTAEARKLAEQVGRLGRW